MCAQWYRVPPARPHALPFTWPRCIGGALLSGRAVLLSKARQPQRPQPCGAARAASEAESVEITVHAERRFRTAPTSYAAP